MTGAAIARIDTPVAPPASAVDTAGFASPPVVAVDVSRVALVKSWIVPAIPPPATIASDHLSQGLMSTTEDAVRTVPATDAAGAAIASSALSSKGTR
jgi:hypothetical protein